MTQNTSANQTFFTSILSSQVTIKKIMASKLSFLLFFFMFTYSMAQPKETSMTLYFQDYSGGPNATVIQVMGPHDGLISFFKFGAMFCTDDPVTEEFEASSAQIARAQGLYVTSALDGSHTHVLISIVFTSNEFKGSTLEVQGSSAQFEQVREVSIVGGTGKFRLARGYATLETIYYDHERHHAVIQCNATVLHYSSPSLSTAN